MTNYKGLSPLYVSMTGEAEAGKALSTTVLDDPTIYISDKKKLVIIIQVAGGFF